MKLAVQMAAQVLWRLRSSERRGLAARPLSRPGATVARMIELGSLAGLH